MTTSIPCTIRDIHVIGKLWTYYNSRVISFETFHALRNRQLNYSSVPSSPFDFSRFSSIFSLSLFDSTRILDYSNTRMISTPLLFGTRILFSKSWRISSSMNFSLFFSFFSPSVLPSHPRNETANLLMSFAGWTNEIELVSNYEIGQKVSLLRNVKFARHSEGSINSWKLG